MANLFIFFLVIALNRDFQLLQDEFTRIPLVERVSIQVDSARNDQIIDGQWVAIGINKEYAIQHDYSLQFNGHPSYYFELKESDNTLEGYAENETKGRAELSYCYATSADFASFPSEVYQQAQIKKTVYLYGKGSCPQGSSRNYKFSIYVPSSLRGDISSIFAQWHGMPDRTLVSTPDGIIKKLSTEEFIELSERMIFKKNIAYDKIPKRNKQGEIFKDINGHTVYKKGKPNGWLIEQGGYPPLAFGFSQGFFYIKANSDRKWFSDKTDRCNASPKTNEIMKPVISKYKTSTIAYKMPFDEFPKDRWVTFIVRVDWTKYGKEQENIIKPGKLDVHMKYEENGLTIINHVVDNEKILIGRNDENGYYFKFGIYRVGNSMVPVYYNLAGYCEY